MNKEIRETAWYQAYREEGASAALEIAIRDQDWAAVVFLARFIDEQVKSEKRNKREEVAREVALLKEIGMAATYYWDMPKKEFFDVNSFLEGKSEMPVSLYYDEKKVDEKLYRYKKFRLDLAGEVK